MDINIVFFDIYPLTEDQDVPFFVEGDRFRNLRTQNGMFEAQIPYSWERINEVNALGVDVQIFYQEELDIGVRGYRVAAQREAVARMDQYIRQHHHPRFVVLVGRHLAQVLFGVGRQNVALGDRGTRHGARFIMHQAKNLFCSFFPLKLLQSNMEAYIPISRETFTLDVYSTLSVKLTIEFKMARVKYSLVAEEPHIVYSLLEKLVARPFVPFKVFGPTMLSLNSMMKENNKIQWMTCDVTVVDICDWNRVSVFTRQNETNYACKKRLLSFIAKNWKHSGVDKEFPVQIEADKPLEL
ncbi:hypothetical protein MBANPS3_000385 [Mucor bainieri]